MKDEGPDRFDYTSGNLSLKNWNRAGGVVQWYSMYLHLQEKKGTDILVNNGIESKSLM